jgi:hypothetical protein
VIKRRKFDPQRATLLEVAYARTGSMLKAARVVSFVIGWDVVRRDLGRSPSVDEYADWWKEHRASAYRHRNEFREVFPGADTPDAVLDLLQAARVTPSERTDYRPVMVAA